MNLLADLMAVMVSTCAVKRFAFSPRHRRSSADHFSTLSVVQVATGVSTASDLSNRASSGSPHGSSETNPVGMRGLLPDLSTAAASAGGSVSLLPCKHGTG